MGWLKNLNVLMWGKRPSVDLQMHPKGALWTLCFPTQWVGCADRDNLSQKGNRLYHFFVPCLSSADVSREQQRKKEGREVDVHVDEETQRHSASLTPMQSGQHSHKHREALLPLVKRQPRRVELEKADPQVGGATRGGGPWFFMTTEWKNCRRTSPRRVNGL